MGWLLVDAALEARRRPVHELDRPLGLDLTNGLCHLVRNNVAAVEEAAGHVLAVAWVALGEGRAWLELSHMHVSS